MEQRLKKSDWFCDWRAREYDKQAQQDEARLQTVSSAGHH